MGPAAGPAGPAPANRAPGEGMGEDADEDGDGDGDGDGGRGGIGKPHMLRKTTPAQDADPRGGAADGGITLMRRP